MKETGSKKEVIRKKALKTKKGDTYDSLIASDKKYASYAKRSESANNSPWRKHVMKYCEKKKINYSAALSDPNCKKGYNKLVKTKKTKSVDTSNQELL